MQFWETAGRCIISHYTIAKTKIKNLDVLNRAADKLGLKVEVGNLKYKTKWTAEIDAVMVFTDMQGGQAAAVKKGDNYELTIDNYGNSITNIVGKDCNILGREYTQMLIEDQAMRMGAMITSTEVNKDGSVEIYLSV